MKSKMLIFIVMLAAGAMMLTACGEESKESSATQSTTQSATQTTTKSSSKDASKSAESKSDNSSPASEKKESSAASGNTVDATAASFTQREVPVFRERLTDEKLALRFYEKTPFL